MFNKDLKQTDEEIYSYIQGEKRRQELTLGLIPSENYASPAVMEATGSVLTNKYSEGYPHKRYYAGQEFTDKVETTAIERAKKLFGADHANVQPHAGSQANMAAYIAMLGFSGKIMGLSLDQGGHLTHGSKVNFSGKLYEIEPYFVDKQTNLLDYDAIEKQAKEFRPDLIVCGYTAYPRTIDFKRFKEIADSVDAKLMADISHIAGLVAGGSHPSPVPYADIVTTTTHKTLRGPRGALILTKEEYAKKVDKAVFPRMQGGPIESTIAAKAVAFKEAMTDEFKDYAHKIVENAKELADALMANGFDLVTGGTDNHLMLIDLSEKEYSGFDAQIALEKAGIVTNKNTIPYDKRKPYYASGVRLGTPSLTTRGMGKSEMKQVADFIKRTMDNMNNDIELEKIRKEVEELCKQFPVYGEIQ